MALPRAVGGVGGVCWLIGTDYNMVIGTGGGEGSGGGVYNTPSHQQSHPRLPQKPGRGRGWARRAECESLALAFAFAFPFSSTSTSEQRSQSDGGSPIESGSRVEGRSNCECGSVCELCSRNEPGLRVEG